MQVVALQKICGILKETPFFTLMPPTLNFILRLAALAIFVFLGYHALQPETKQVSINAFGSSISTK